MAVHKLLPWKILGVMGAHSGRSRAHLAVSTEQVLFQTSEGVVVKIEFAFYHGPQWQPVWLRHHVALIAWSRIANYQLPTSSGAMASWAACAINPYISIVNPLRTDIQTYIHIYIQAQPQTKPPLAPTACTIMSLTLRRSAISHH